MNSSELYVRSRLCRSWATPEDWAYVFNPRTRGTAYVHSDLLGPGHAPSSFVTADPPPVDQEWDRTGQVDEATSLSFYPPDDPGGRLHPAGCGLRIELTGSITGDDGQQWYRTVDGDYLPASAVSFASPTAPSTPASRSRRQAARSRATGWTRTSACQRG